MVSRSGRARRRTQLLLLAGVAVAGIAQARAEGGSAGRRLYVEVGATPDGGRHSQSWTVGALLPSALWGGIARQAGPLTLHWDLWASHWRVPRETGRSGLSQVGAVAAWRYALAGMGTPWFLEFGIGASWMDRLYATPRKRFSTAFQFTEVVGIGYRFGPAGAHEVSLRYQHFSNGGIERPNPGQDFVRLRWATTF